MWSLNKWPSSSLGVNVNNSLFLGRNCGVKSRQQHYTARFSLLMSILIQSQWDYRKLCPIMFQNNRITAKERHQVRTCQADSFPASAWAKNIQERSPSDPEVDRINIWLCVMWLFMALLCLYPGFLKDDASLSCSSERPFHVRGGALVLCEGWVPAAR